MGKDICNSCGHEAHWEYCDYAPQSEYMLGSGCGCASGEPPPKPAEIKQLREQLAEAQATIERVKAWGKDFDNRWVRGVDVSEALSKDEAT